MTKPKARNKSEKKKGYSFTVPPPVVDSYYVANICPAHPTMGHNPLYDKDDKPMAPVPQNLWVNLRTRICQDCGSVYVEQGQDLHPGRGLHGDPK